MVKCDQYMFENYKKNDARSGQRDCKNLGVLIMGEEMDLWTAGECKNKGFCHSEKHKGYCKFLKSIGMYSPNKNPIKYTYEYTAPGSFLFIYMRKDFLIFPTCRLKSETGICM